VEPAAAYLDATPAHARAEAWQLDPEPAHVPAGPWQIEREPAPSPEVSTTPYGFRPAEFTPAVFNPIPTQSNPLPAPQAPARSLSTTMARVGEELLAWFKTLVSAAVYATLIVTFGFQVARVEGQSMAPTLADQDRLIVNKLAYRLHDPQVGDVVMLLFPEDPKKSFVKRVVGEPGDTLRAVDGQVYRNEVPLSDDFIPEEFRDHQSWGPEVVRPGYYFVMGDHRNNSSDSRTWGLVPTKYIIGKVQLRWWPLGEARIF
jgi:signal peptidase I